MLQRSGEDNRRRGCNYSIMVGEIVIVVKIVVAFKIVVAVKIMIVVKIVMAGE